MGQRYPNLYELDRWRRYGYLLLVIGLIAVGVGGVISARSSGQAGAGDWLLVGALGIGLGLTFWLRQRSAYVQVEERQLILHVLMASQRLDLAEVRRARAARLGAVLERSGGRRAPRRLQDADAIVIRLRHPDASRFARLLSRRCILGDEVVIPTRNAVGLQREIESAIAGSARNGGPAAGRSIAAPSSHSKAADAGRTTSAAAAPPGGTGTGHPGAGASARGGTSPASSRHRGRRR